MRDVARAAGGVHPSTVSLALRNDPAISAATRKRVRAAARRLGYRPDPLLDAFNTHRLEVVPKKGAAVIACIFDFTTRSAMQESPAHRALWASASAAAELFHCRLEPFFLAPGVLTPARMNSILRARNITALLLAALRSGSSVAGLEWDPVSAIRIESMHCDLPRFTVSTDHRQAARLACRKLRAAGHARIGLVLGGSEPQAKSDLWRAAVLVEEMRSGSGTSAPVLAFSRSNPATVNAVQRWLATNHIDAVLTDIPDFHAWAVAGDSRSTSCPCAVLDMHEGRSGAAGMVSNMRELAAQAVAQLVGLMRTNQRGQPATQSCTFIPAEWSDGG